METSPNSLTQEFPPGIDLDLEASPFPNQISFAVLDRATLQKVRGNMSKSAVLLALEMMVQITQLSPSGINFQRMTITHMQHRYVVTCDTRHIYICLFQSGQER